MRARRWNLARNTSCARIVDQAALATRPSEKAGGHVGIKAGKAVSIGAGSNPVATAGDDLAANAGEKANTGRGQGLQDHGELRPSTHRATWGSMCEVGYIAKHE